MAASGLFVSLSPSSKGYPGSAKHRAVLAAAGLTRSPLSALAAGRVFDRPAVARLLAAMQEHSRPVKPDALGVIGEDHLRAALTAMGAEPASVAYKQVSGVEGGLPWLAEVAFAHVPSQSCRAAYYGVNWSAGIANPFQGFHLDYVLARQKVRLSDPVIMFVHLAAPAVRYLDRGKSAVAVSQGQAKAITGAVEAITKRWEKEKTRAERSQSAAAKEAFRREKAARRAEEADEDVKKTLKAACATFFEMAYMKASTGGAFPAMARQVWYVLRGPVEKAARAELRYEYFTQHILPNYVADTGVSWNIVYDARGHFTEPHGGRRFEIGTREVRSYLADVARAHHHGPGNVKGLYSALLFFEKEGFDQLFAELRLGNEYDIATMSTKGVATTAFRELAETLCSTYNIPLLVLHDFDVSGFSIVGTLREGGSTKRYTFTKPFKRVDLGLRLADVEAYSLEPEDTGKRPSPAQLATLRRHGATEAEVAFLAEGKRVELNAFETRDLVDFIKRKLDELGIKKITPPQSVLAPVYEAAARESVIERKVAAYRAQLERETQTFQAPDDLFERMTAGLSESPAKHWRTKVEELAEADAAQ